MLLHDNYILFFVNLKVVVEFHSKVKCTNCILNIKCISTMAESHKTLKEDVNLSNKGRNNSVPNIAPHTSGTSDTHPTHHAAVSEPSTIKRKQTSFQITSVTVKGSRLSTDGGEDSADDLDESHTEDVSSDILDCSKTTDVDNDQLSEDNSITTNNDDSASPSIPNTKCKAEQPLNPGEQIDNFPSKDSKIDKPNEIAASSDLVKEPPPDQWQHRFRVVKIVSSEPFKRGRWLCTDFMDPPAPVTEAKAEIVETAVNTNIQMISGSFTDSIPADKIAHIYEISPGNAYSGSITVNDGTDQIRQPMYGIFLPLNNKQYPLITGMHSLAVQPRLDRGQQSTIGNQGINNMATVSQIQNSTNNSRQIQNVSGMQQVQSATSMHQPQSIPQSQNIANVQQTQNVPVNFHQSQHVASNLQQSQNIAALQQIQSASGVLPHSQNANTGMQPAQNYPTTLQVVPNVMTTMQQSPMNVSTLQHVNMAQQHHSSLQPSSIPVNVHQQNVSKSGPQNVNITYQPTHVVHGSFQQPQNIVTSSVQQPINVITSMQQPQNVSSMQQPHNVISSIQQPHNVTSIQQSQSVVTSIQQPHNVSSMQQPQNVANFQQAQTVSSLPHQNVITNASQAHMSGIQHPQSIAAATQQPHSMSSVQQPQHIVTSMHQSQHIASNVSQPPIVTSMHQQMATNVQQPQQVITSMSHQPQITNIQQAQSATGMYQPQNVTSMQSQQNTASLNPPQSLQLSHSYQQLPISNQSTINGNNQLMPGDGMQVVNIQSVSNPVLSTTNFQNEAPQGRMDLIQQHGISGGSSAPTQQLSQESRPPQNQTMSLTPPQSLSETHNSKSLMDATPSASRIVDIPQAASMQPSVANVIQTSIIGTQTSVTNIPEVVPTSSIQQQPETVVTSQVTQNHVEVKELGTPPSTNAQVVQETAPEAVASKGDVNGEESESVPSGTSTVAIDNKIEQAMDLVKSHLMFAVREEVDVLKEKITELMDRISQLEYENGFLKANASQQTLEQLNQSQLLQQQQQQQQQIQPMPIPMNSISQQPIQQPQTNIQNQQPTS